MISHTGDLQEDLPCLASSLPVCHQQEDIYLADRTAGPGQSFQSLIPGSLHFPSAVIVPPSVPGIPARLPTFPPVCGPSFAWTLLHSLFQESPAWSSARCHLPRVALAPPVCVSPPGPGDSTEGHFPWMALLLTLFPPGLQQNRSPQQKPEPCSISCCINTQKNPTVPLLCHLAFWNTLETISCPQSGFRAALSEGPACPSLSLPSSSHPAKSTRSTQALQQGTGKADHS